MMRNSRSFVASSTTTRAAMVHYGADAGRRARLSDAGRQRDVSRRGRLARANGDCAQIRLRHGAPLIVSAGRLVDSKGWIHLLRAFQLLSQKIPEATLVIAGDGMRRKYYESLAESLQISARVHFVGQRTASELAALYAAADVFAIATLTDPYCAVIPESMTCGTVTLSSVHAAATADLIVDGDTGFIADPRDERSFAQALARAVNCRLTAAPHCCRAPVGARPRTI